jgi:hypothetical protein
MDLIPIHEHIEENKEFADKPLCQETILPDNRFL